MGETNLDACNFALGNPSPFWQSRLLRVGTACCGFLTNLWSSNEMGQEENKCGKL